MRMRIPQRRWGIDDDLEAMRHFALGRKVFEAQRHPVRLPCPIESPGKKGCAKRPSRTATRPTPDDGPPPLCPAPVDEFVERLTDLIALEVGKCDVCRPQAHRIVRCVRAIE